MINFYNLAAFSADFPDDWMEEGDEIIEFPGRLLITAIAELLRAKGYSVSDPMFQMEKGWDLVVDHEKASVWMNVTSFDERRFVLQHASRSRFVTLHRELYAEVMQALNEGLREDERFGEVLWFDKFGEPAGFLNPRVETPGNEKRPAPKEWEGW